MEVIPLNGLTNRSRVRSWAIVYTDMSLSGGLYSVHKDAKHVTCVCVCTYGHRYP